MLFYIQIGRLWLFSLSGLQAQLQSCGFHHRVWSPCGALSGTPSSDGVFFYERCAHLFDCEASRIEGFRAAYRLPRHFVSFEIKAPIIRPAYQESAAAERCSAARSICRIICLSKGIIIFDMSNTLWHPSKTALRKIAPFHSPPLPYTGFFWYHET